MDPSAKRKSVVKSLAGSPVERLLDIGCGPITPSYPYADLASEVVCVDHALKVIDGAPPNVLAISGQLDDVVDTGMRFDLIVCADVFEHIPLEAEKDFVASCLKVLNDDGRLIVTVPHAGKYAYLDPYQVRPAIHRLLFRIGAYKKTFNGTCDIRKGHKHYTRVELTANFKGFTPLEVRYYGYAAEPLAATVLSLRKRGVPVPFTRRITAALFDEHERDDFGEDAYSMGIMFKKA